MNIKKSCVLCRNFSSIYKINRTLHHYMVAQGYKFYLLVLKVSLTRERCFQHSKIKFVSPRRLVISSIINPKKRVRCKFVRKKFRDLHGIRTSRSIFRVNLQLLKLQLPLRRSYPYLNLHFRSSHRPNSIKDALFTKFVRVLNIKYCN